MKKSLLFILLIAATVSYGVFHFTQEYAAQTELAAKELKFAEKHAAKNASIHGFVEWRNNLITNNETGVFDPMDRVEAIAYADEMKSVGSRKASGVLNLEWDVKGPDSQGGRTRAILFDKDVNGLIYTGGISGGMFKSTDNAQNWERMESYNGNASIMSLAQSINGTLFVGTGEILAGSGLNGSSYNASITGNGIFKSTDAGETWTHIDATAVSFYPTSSGAWTAVNALAANPNNTNNLLAGTRNGIFVTTNAEAGQPNFTQVIGASSNTVSAVEITTDGEDAWAAISGRVFKSTDNAGDFATGWSQFNIPGGTSATRAQIAVSTVDESGDYIVYVSLTNGSGCLVGVHKTEDKGATWEQIVTAGSTNPDPFAQPTGGATAGCQGWYDHCIAVNPVDKDKIYIGGITFYTWGAGSGGLKRADQIDTEGAGSLDPNYIHADKHFIKFNPHDETGNTMVICGDGGMNFTLNANDGFPDNMVYTENNKNYTTLQLYSVASGKYGEVMGGAQDNGTQYVDYRQISQLAAKEVSGGDGVFAEISNLDPDVLFSAYVQGQLYRSLNNGESVTDFRDENIDPGGCGFITCSPLNTGAGETCDDRDGLGQSFVFPFFLLESFDRLTPQMDAYVYAKDDTIPTPGGGYNVIRETIEPGDVTDKVIIDKIPGAEFDNTGVTYDLPATLFPGDTFYFENKWDSKYFAPTACAARLYVCTNPLQKGTAPIFTSVDIPLQGGFKKMDGSYDGDMMVAVGGTRVTITQGWDAFSPDNAGSITYEQVNLSGIGVSGVGLEGVAVDKNNKDHVLVTEAGYGSNSKVFVSMNATSASPTFTNIHNNLPEIPVYSCVIDQADPNRYILGTELGIWTSNDGGVSWTEDNDGMGGRFPVYSLRQKWMNNFDCYLLAAGSLGAGMFTTTSLMECADKNNLKWGRPAPTDITNVSVEVNNILVYPNPVNDIAKVSFNLSTTSTVTLKVIDLMGRVISSTNYTDLSSGSNTLEINASTLAKGTYYAVLSTDNKSYGNRLFIKK